MTIQAWWLLRKLKKAQTCLDGQISIDPEKLVAITVHAADQPWKEIGLKQYANSLDATLKHLQEQGCINFDDQYCVKVTYIGWHFFSATVLGTVRGLILNVIVPIAVSVIAAIVTTLLMTGS